MTKLIRKVHKSGVYNLQCSDCDSVYIGQTGRSFVSLYKEHLFTFINKHPDKSQFAKRLLEKGQLVSKSFFFWCILYIRDKGLKLDLLGHWYNLL